MHRVLAIARWRLPDVGGRTGKAAFLSPELNIDVTALDGDVVVARFSASCIDAVPDCLEFDGRAYRATVHVGPFPQCSGRPLWLLLVTAAPPS